MPNYNRYTNVRKFYHVNLTDEEDNDSFTFGYCNWDVWRSTVETVNMLVEMIQEDFPGISTDDIHIQRKSTPPRELILIFYFTSEELEQFPDIDLSSFEPPPSSIMEFFIH